MPFAQYLAAPGINATSLKAGQTSMLHMRHALIGEPPPPREETPAMRWGRLVHLAILEPDRLASTLAVWEGGRRAGGAWEQFCDEHNREWIVVPDENADLMRMSAAVHSTPVAHRLIAQSEHERVVTWRDKLYGQGRARLDCLGAAFFADLKTTARISGFTRQFFSLGYDVQFGWYHEACQRQTAWVIVAESVAPWDCAVYQIPPAVLDTGRARAVELAKQYRACEAVGAWPGVDKGAGGGMLPVPAWYNGGGEGVELKIGGESVAVTE
jgi:exodeoxyribonuclease VIII